MTVNKHWIKLSVLHLMSAHKQTAAIYATSVCFFDKVGSMCIILNRAVCVHTGHVAFLL